MHRVQHVEGAFVIERDGERLAAMVYSGGPERITIEHTEVSDALRGTGAGVALLEALVAWARETGTKVKVRCPFARSVFTKREDLRDVLG